VAVRADGRAATIHVLKTLRINGRHPWKSEELESHHWLQPLLFEPVALVAALAIVEQRTENKLKRYLGHGRHPSVTMPLSTSCMYPLATVTLEWDGLVFRQRTNDCIRPAIGSEVRGRRA